MSLATVPRRSLWGYRGSNNWSSHLDPLYHRFHRIRTLKTRAKLLSKLRRRAKFDWDSNAATFFTPKHVRWASRWDGCSSRRKDLSDDLEDNLREKKPAGREEVEAGEERGYELSRREKVWKEQMERMRKRIESDPYEAIFGKRFEPFWSPLVPSWMREEMGLPVWYSRDSAKQAESVKKADHVNIEEQAKSDTVSQRADEKAAVKAVSFKSDPETGETVREEINLSMPSSHATKNTGVTDTSFKKDPDTGETLLEKKDLGTPSSYTAHKTGVKAVNFKKDPATGETVREERHLGTPSSYAYASSTSWNSWSNKTKRMEWDSLSGQTKTYEYDPVSNRMVQIEAPAAAQTKPDETTKSSHEYPQADGGSEGEIDIPVKQPPHVRKSIPIPPPLSQPSNSLPVGFSPRPTSVGPLKSTAVASGAPKPSALTNLDNTESRVRNVSKHMDLNDLTAESIRAKMPKLSSKSTTPPPATNPQQQGEQDHISSFSSLDAQPQIDALNQFRDMLKHRQYTDKHTTEWDRAESDVMLEREIESLNKKKEKLLKDERGLFHIERQKREVMKLDQRLREVAERLGRLNVNSGVTQASSSAASSTHAEVKTPNPVLQPSLDRMMSSPRSTAKLSAAEEAVDADDAAAHESTEPIAACTTASNVPAHWEKQVEMLQADRVRRTSSKAPYPDMRTLITEVRKTKAVNAKGRDIADPELLKSASATSQTRPNHEANQSQKGEEKAAIERANNILKARQQLEADVKERQKAMEVAEMEKALSDRAAKLEKANALLEAEVKEQKFRMQAHENRYAHKLRSLRGELETAYKQSSVHGQKHVERQRSLEDTNKTLREQAATLTERASSATESVEEKYTKKIKLLRTELETAYKQSTVHSEKHLERIKDLETALQKAQATTQASKAVPEMAQAEGDLGAGVAKFAGTEKWYKQPATTPQSIKREMEKAAAKRKDRELVNEVRRIYENAYGVIGSEHLLRPYPRTASEAAERESESASAAKEAKSGRPIGVVEVESDVDLGEALASWEKEKDTAAKRANPYAARRQWEKDALAAKEREANEGVTLLRDITAHEEVRTPITEASPTMPIIQWANPPLYKILAYDAGNDRISMATAPSNFWAKTETPISMAEALGRVYAPAKFVGELAALQEEGWEVVDAGKDVVVFRKVKTLGEVDSKNTKPSNFASTPSEALTSINGTRKASDGRAIEEAEGEEDDPFTTIRHYPRVKREEYPVFTGTNRKWGSSRRLNKEARRERRQRRRTVWKSMIGTGLLAGGVAYTVGSLEEKSRRSQEEVKRLREG